MVSPTTSPVDRAVRLTLAMDRRSRSRSGGRLVTRYRERDDDAGAAAFARRNGDVPSQLHGEAADQGQAEAAAASSSLHDGLRWIETVILDHEFDLLAALVRLDSDLGRGDRAEVVVERPADRFGHDQADRDGDIGTDRHDRRADGVARRRAFDAGPRDR